MINPYKSKEFKKLQKEWYAKLSDKGFDDLEKYGDHMLFSRNSPTLSHLQRRMNNETVKHYTILQTFLHKANFLRRSLPVGIVEYSYYNIRRKPGSVPIENLADEYQTQYYYPHAEYVLLQSWTSGLNLQECTDKLQSMLKQKKLKYPMSLPIPRKPSKISDAISIFWVKTRIDYLTKEAYNYCSSIGENLNDVEDYSTMSPEDILIDFESKSLPDK